MIHVPASEDSVSARASALRRLRAVGMVLLALVLSAIPLLNGSVASAGCWVGAPTNVAAKVAPTTGVGRGEAQLTWAKPASNAACADEYAIQHSTDGTNWSHVVTVSNKTFSFTVGGLSHGTTHRLRVAGVNTYEHVGPGDWSVVEATTPTWAPIAPGGLTAVAAPAPGVDSRELKLTWNTPTDDGGVKINSYAIHRSTDGINWTPLNGVTTTTAFVSGLSNGTKYWFRVAAVNTVGLGPWSTTTGTPAWWPDAPGQLTALAAPEPGVGSGQVKLTWTAPASTGGTLTDYFIKWSADGQTWTPVQDPVSTTTGYTVSGLSNGVNYQFQVTAMNGAGLQSTAATANATPMWKPDAPIVTATVAPADGVGSGEVKLSWTEPASNGSPITDYHIESSVDGSSWLTLDDGISTATSYTVRDLPNNRSWSFQVWAKNDVGFSQGSVVVRATPVGEPTVAPGELTATVAPSPGPGSGEVKLAWDAAAPSGAGVTDYVIESSTDGTTWTPVDDGVSTDTSFMVGGLSNGTPYSFRVAAANQFGAGPPSAIVQVTPVWMPGSPDEVTAAVAPADGVGSGEVRLSWLAPADNGSAITDYVIEWSTDGDTWTLVDDGTSTDIAYTVAGLIDGTEYVFRVAAVNALGQGQPSLQTPATPVWLPSAPDAPTAIVGTGPGQVQLTWTGPADNGAPITDYVIEWSADGTGWTMVDDGVSTATTSTVGGLTNGLGYQFRVAAVNVVGAGPASSPQFATPVWSPEAPGGLRAAVAPATGVGSGQVKLTWTAASDNGASVTDYVVQRSTDGVTWTTVADGVSTATTSTVRGLTNGKTYRFRVAPVNAIGQGEWSSTVAATPRWKPAAPAGLRVRAGSGRVMLSWRAPASNGSAVTDYVIQRSTGTTWTTVRDGVSTSRTYTVTRLINNRQYRFRVAAKNAAGQGPWSVVVRAAPRAR